MRVPKRRRRENKTSYRLRLGLLKSGFPRVIIRKTNNYIIAQYVKSKEAQDNVIVGVNSKDLIKYGFPQEWRGSLKSIPAAYLTGYLLGKKILGKEKKDKIQVNVDLGVQRKIYGSRIFSAIKGLVDSGITIKSKKPEIYPSEDRIKGMHMKKDVEKIIDQIKSKVK